MKCKYNTSMSVFVLLQTLKTDSFSRAAMKTVFVTVGTTSFDELIESVTSPETVQVSKVGYKIKEAPTATAAKYKYSLVEEVFKMTYLSKSSSTTPDRTHSNRSPTFKMLKVQRF